MSTRCTTHFIGYGGRLEAIVYRHTDGYPEGHGRDLARFFEDVEAQTADTRFSDASYLAAKLVVWLAREFARSQPLDFLSVGICMEDPGDIEYRYIVDTQTPDVNGRPLVTAQTATGVEVVIPGAEGSQPDALDDPSNAELTL